MTVEVRELYNALHRKSGFEVVNEANSEKQIRIIGRVTNNRMPTWLVVIQRLLIKAEEAPWSIDISKQYFLRGGKVLFGWRVILQGENIASHLDSIAEVISGAPVMKMEINEVPIQRSAHRTQMIRGRGAQVIGGDAGTPPIVAAKLGI
jgi:hypothetical protein